MEFFLYKEFICFSKDFTFKFFRTFNCFYFFSLNIAILKFLEVLVKRFFLKKNFQFSKIIFFNGNILERFNFFDFDFYYLNYCLLGTVSVFVIRDHKRRLKLLVKDFSLNLFFSLKNLNLLILNWINSFYFSDFSFDIFSEIDIYLYKLLWKWARRRHPRRPRTWIYNKYWKFYLGSWKFFVFDLFLGKFLFLISHSFSNFKFYRLPTSLNAFNKFNNLKLNNLWFIKCMFSLRGLFKFLWKKQFGRCFLCNRVFVFFNLEELKVLYNSTFNLILVHVSCVYLQFKNLLFLIIFMLSPKKMKFRKTHRGRMKGTVSF